MIKYHEVLNNFSVGDLVNTDYQTLNAGDSLEKAANMLVHHSDHGFVIKSGNEFRGILTKEDLIRGLTTRGNSAEIQEIITSPAYVVEPKKPLNTVFEEMIKNKYELVPVISKGNFEGVLDIENIKELIMVRQAERQFA